MPETPNIEPDSSGNIDLATLVEVLADNELDVVEDRTNYAPTKGRVIKETPSGTRYLGDGDQWIDIDADGGFAPPSVRTEEINNTHTPSDGAELESVFANLSAGDTIELQSNTTYTLSAGLVVDVPNVTIKGPRSAILDYDSGGVQDTFFHVAKNADAPNFTARGFTVDATNQTNPTTDGIENDKSACGVLIDGETNLAADSLVKNVHFKKVKNEAVGHWGRSGDTNNLLRGRVRDCLFEDIRFRAVHPHNSHTVHVTDCTFINMTHADHETTIRHSDLIENCRFFNCTGNRVIYGSSDGSLIIGNTFVECEAPVVYSWRKNADRVENNSFIRGSGTSAVCKTDGGPFHVVDNQFYFIPRQAVTAIHDNSEIRGNTVINPSQSESGWQAFLLDANDCEVVDNTVRCPSSTTYSDGVQINSGSGHEITDNKFRGYTANAVEFNGGTAYRVKDNNPVVATDVRNSLDATDGAEGYHDGTNSNTYGPAFYDGNAAALKSLVDGTTIS